MVRLGNENILIIGDRDRKMQSSVANALPSASVTSVQSVFDALAELNAGVYSGVLVNLDPIVHRPEAATRALREAANEARLIVYSEPVREPLSRTLTRHGADHYIITPPDSVELQRVLIPELPIRDEVIDKETVQEDEILKPLLELPMTDLVLSAMLEHPQQAMKQVVHAIAERVAPALKVVLQSAGEPMPTDTESQTIVSQPVRDGDGVEIARLVLTVDQPVNSLLAEKALGRIAQILSKVAQIDDRQARLQKLAITDDLTGVYNARYFKHFLHRILEKAKAKRFPVTLFLFDIDNFKKYNDTYGHGVGDEILKQTASLMKRCSRDHDLVARISGDEFAVVFWEKEGPRQAYDAQQPVSRLPDTPLIIADRFRKLLSNKDLQDFKMLGASGKGVLTISGGMAVYPYDAQSAEELIEAADKALMFGAKKSGKNSIYLVGGEQNTNIDPETSI
jgi:diguanylate cyclase (GGDEF)-like protein